MKQDNFLDIFFDKEDNYVIINDYDDTYNFDFNELVAGLVVATKGSLTSDCNFNNTDVDHHRSERYFIFG